jgi:hypothetical protein
MAKLNIDYDELILLDGLDVGLGAHGAASYVSGYHKLWEMPPQGCSFTDAIKMMHERTLRITELLETAINVMGDDVGRVPRGQRPGSDGFKP